MAELKRQAVAAAAAARRDGGGEGEGEGEGGEGGGEGEAAAKQQLAGAGRAGLMQAAFVQMFSEWERAVQTSQQRMSAILEVRRHGLVQQPPQGRGGGGCLRLGRAST
jgi:hypothetical protein